MNITAALDLLGTLLAQAIKVSSMIAKARAEGRESLTSAEVDQLALENDQARSRLQAAIDGAKEEGR